MAVPYLLLGVVRERLVNDVPQLVVLPETDASRDPDCEQTDDQPRPRLLEVVHDAQFGVVLHRPDLGRRQCAKHLHWFALVEKEAADYAVGCIGVGLATRSASTWIT